ERDEVTLRVGRDEGLVGVADDLVLLGRLVGARVDRQDGGGHRGDEPSAARNLFFFLFLGRRQPLDLGEVRRGLGVLAAEVRDGRGERQQLAALARLSARGGRLDAALDPAPGVLY